MVITDFIPSPKKHERGTEAETGKKRSSFAKIFKSSSTDESTNTTKVVFMSRHDYQRYFARDEKEECIGTEPYKRWTEEELDERFGQYRPEKASEENGGKMGKSANSVATLAPSGRMG
jgi:hypothetical protein